MGNSTRVDGKASILIVDDRPQNLLALEATLAAVADVAVVRANSGNEALAAMLGHDFALAILDVQMPEMDGFELAALMRGCERTQHTPIIFLTAGSSAENMVFKGYESGAVDYIVKPYNAAILLAKVEVFLDLDRLRRELEEQRQHQEQLVELRTRKLAESENKYRALVDSLPDGVTLTDREGKVVLCNQEAARMHGYENPEAMQGIGAHELIAADERPRAAQNAQRTLEEGCGTSIEYTLLRKDGSRFPGELNAALIRDAEGAPAGFIGTTRDITARKLTEHALVVSETRYRRLFEAAQDGILILDAGTGKIVDVNPFLIELTGYSREDFLGQHLWEIGPFKDIAASKASFAALQAKEYVRYEDLPLKTKDGRLIEVEFVSNVYLVDNQNVIQCNVRDVSKRKREETERQKLEEQLRASQKMEAIGSLAGGIAHDFNNLLSVILSYTAFAMAGVPEGNPLKDDLLEVKKAADRAVALTRQLLAFSRKQVLQPVPLDLNQSATGIEKMLRRILGEDIDLVQNLAPDLGLTLADPGQIEQVLMNLVVNARDAMPEGGKLTIETSNVEIDEEYAASHVAVKPGPYVQLAITDMGSGMDGQTKAMLFEPFFTTKEKGTGLGLSTVYGIVKQSGGNIWVYSELGQGTTFKIYLPRELSATAATATTPRTAPKRTTGTETVLVVEDEEALRKVARRTLDAAGYTVLMAASGEEALRICAQHAGEIHLLLTDVVMSRMNGRVLAQEVSKTRPTVKVVYMSGYTDDAIVRHGVLNAGVNFLAKPFAAADLARKVREVLDDGVTNLADGYEQAVKTDAETGEPPLDKDILRAAPADVRNKLRKAVTTARYDEIVEIIETIRISDPNVATGLRRMADRFDYDGLRDLLSWRKDECNG
jgi:two-component system, cell cycle sensor histidine kinase and response regulator CckA